jgi:hypothetical protein
VKLEETREFPIPVSAGEAVVVREDIASILTDQALAIIADTAETVKAKLAEMPRGHVSVHQVNPAAPQGVAYNTAAPAQPGPAQVAAVANGAAFQTEWKSVPSKFGDGDLRFITTASYSSGQLEADVANWLRGKGLNPILFKTWDNRPGARGLEAGVPNGSVAAVKVSKEIIDACPPDFQKIPAARVKFNSDGTLYVYFTKEFESFLKYGGVAIFGAQSAPAQPAAEQVNPF